MELSEIQCDLLSPKTGDISPLGKLKLPGLLVKGDTLLLGKLPLVVVERKFIGPEIGSEESSFEARLLLTDLRELMPQKSNQMQIQS